MRQGIHKLIQLFAGVVFTATMVAQNPPAPPNPPTPPEPPAPAVAPHVVVHPRTVIVRNGSSSGYLGVSVRDLSHDEASALKLPDDSGVQVTVVDQDSPAGKAGIKEHDVIRTFDGEKVESRSQLFRMLTETPAGHTVTVELLRNGQPLSVKLQLADRRTFAREMPMPRVEIPEIHIPPINIEGNMELMMGTARSGVQVESLSPQLRDFFGAPADQGLLVRTVEKGSPAEQAGLRAGDVIVKVQDRTIRGVGDYRMALRDASGKSVTIGIVRDKREQSVTLKLPERRESSSAAWGYDYDIPGLDFDLAGIDALRNEAAAWQTYSQEWKDWQKSFAKSQKEWQKDWEKQMKDWQKQWKDYQ